MPMRLLMYSPAGLNSLLVAGRWSMVNIGMQTFMIYSYLRTAMVPLPMTFIVVNEQSLQISKSDLQSYVMKNSVDTMSQAPHPPGGYAYGQGYQAGK